MRRVAVPSVSLALMLAFLMAPFQHIHLAARHDWETDHDHDDPAIVHAHFYAETVPVNRNTGSNLKDSHGEHASQSLDTFTPIPQAGLIALVLPQSRILLFRLADLLVGVVEVTESRSHDPPFIDFSIPRAPPA